MVAPAFGFSAGDFIAAVQLIGQVAAALRDSTGATKQYQQAALELELLRQTLQTVQALEPSTDNAATIQKVQLCSHACHIPLSEFLASIRRFESPLSSSGSGSHAIIRAWRKVQWAVSVEKDLAKLKSKIGPMLSLITILLQTEGLEEISRQNRVMSSDVETGRRTLGQLQNLEAFLAKEVATKDQIAAVLPAIENLSLEQRVARKESSRSVIDSTNAIQDRLRAQERLLQTIIDHTYGFDAGALADPSTPATARSHHVPISSHPESNANANNELVLQIQYVLLALRSGIASVSWMLLYLGPAFQKLCRILTALPRAPTLLLEDNIRLEDALGRVLSLPYEHFRYWPVLQARLECEFMNKPGQHNVAQHQYHIINLLGGGNRVFTKATWDRSVFPGAQLAMSMLFENWVTPKRACPRCNVVAEGCEAQGWKQCASCKLTYRMLEYEPRTKSNTDRPSPVDIMDNVEFITDIAPLHKTHPISDPETFSLQDIEYFRRIHIIGRLDAEAAGAEFGAVSGGVGRVSFDLQASGDVEGRIPGSSNASRRGQARGILRTPTEKFPEDPHSYSEGLAPLKDLTKSGIPPGARWTKIDRRLVNPQALEEAKERFEERLDCVIVLRVLTKEEVQKLANRTRDIRATSAPVSS